MSSIRIETTIHVFEDTDGNFDIRDILANAGYLSNNTLKINSMTVVLPDGSTSSKDTPLFGKVDADTVYVRPGKWAPDYNGKFSTFELVLEQGTSSNSISLNLRVVVDPVNDAPSAANKAFTLADGAPVRLADSDFGFVDAIDRDAFKSVIITSLPSAGKLTLDGVAVAVNSEISVADIQAGKLAFEPSQSASGLFEVGFKVRDAGGLVGPGAADTSVAPNYLSFKVPQAHVGDLVWEDSNGNGVQDAGEAGLGGVEVQLKAADGKLVATSITDASGNYHFDVDAGTYTVTVKAPAGYAATNSGQGGDTGADSDSDIDANGVSAPVVLTPGATNNNVDAGWYRPVTLGDRVWYDSNRNGVQDGNEAGVAGVKVTLLDANGQPVGAAVTTDANGHYQFSNLKPGTYSVQFDKATLPAHYLFTTAGAGSDSTVDSNANVDTGLTAPVVLRSGASVQHIDAGIVIEQATLGDRVWEDNNGNGMQDGDEAGLDGVLVQLKDASGKVVGSATTHDGGQYSFTVDPGTYSVSVAPPAGYAFTTAGKGSDGALDSDVDASGVATVTLAAGQQHADLDAGVYRAASLSQVVWFDANRDGRLNDGETGAAGVRVTLLDASGAAVQGATAVTDANGHYQFSNLKPGNYSVQFDKSSLPAGFNFTSAAQGGPGGVGSDADTGTGQTAQIALASGEDMVLRAGLVVQQATLGDRVWEDSNGNGVQDAGEAGLVGVTVDLKDEKGNIVKTTTTGDDGQYSFTIDPGKYTVSVTAPAGMTATTQNAGTVSTTDSDINAAGQSAVITLAANQVNKDVDAGFYKSASLGSNVWLDANRNGLQDADEAGVAGVRVVLLDANGKPAGVEAVTDQNGAYSFTNLKPGTYSVQFDKTSLPAKHAFTIAGAGNDSAIDSDANTSTGISAPVTLKSGDVNTTVDAGIVSTTGKLGDLVWEDSNANGIQDDGEQGIANVTVQLKDSSGKVVQTTTTGADGKYSFTAEAGNYTVAVTAPKDYVFSAADVGSDDGRDSDISSSSGSSGQSASVKLAAGDVNNSIDAGLYKTASVGDRVWLDKNGDGIQDSSEAGLAGVKVSLLDANGKQVGATVVTDAKGNYQFSGLKPGTYSVQFDKASLPEGMAFTKADAGTDDSIDSDAGASGRSHSFTLTSGQVDKSVDAGVLAAATIGNRVWFDKNGNGVQDDGESGKAGVVVELRDTSGKLVKSATTDSNGNYKFSVEAGTYSVAMKTPTGFSTTAQNAGNSAIDSDADASGRLGTVTVAAGDNVTHLDAGVYQKVEIGDKVWYDTNGDGIQQSSESGARGVKVSLLNDKGVVVATQTTDAKGQYLFGDIGPGNYSVKVDAPDGYIFTRQYQGASTLDSDMDSSGQSAQFFAASGSSDKTRDAGLVKAASIGDTVWEDSNYNGVRDASEKGVDGVTVKLYDANNVLKATTVTQDGGQYSFGNLLSGNYKVEVTNGSGWFFTKTGAGTDATDSDIVTVNSAGNVGRTGTIALGVGQNITTEDAGIYRKASIGDKVWRDSNHNGVQDAGEEGIGGILVGLFDATTKKQLGNTIKTDSNGNYKFTDLTPGSYYVVFDKTDVKFKSYNMSDWKWGVKNTGSNDAVDSDVIGDGKSLANVTKTDTITLTSGKNDMSWDAAITPIAIDLDGDGIHTIARADMTGSFDLLGTGTAIRSGWLSKGDGFLAVDSNGNGRIDDISELFGGNGKGQGFAKLASYDSNGDGKVDASDSGFATLRIWQDANSDGQTDAGELISLAQAGVVSLTVAHTDLAFLDANHNLHMEGSSVTLANGKSAAMTDVYFNVAAADAAAAGITAPTIADLLDTAGQGAQAALVGQAPAAII